LTLNGAEIVLASDGRRSFYYDLGTGEPFLIPETGKELIQSISLYPVELEGTELYNIKTAHRALVYDQAKAGIFRIGEEEPEAVRNIEDFDSHYFLATIKGTECLCTKHDRQVVRLGS
ncbi:MAG: hypothetical protein AAF597_14655, partial [Bacteroidota bacterium]